MKIIVLNGAPRSGKNTAGELLDNLLWVDSDKCIEQFSFILPVKKAIAGLFDIDLEDIEAAKDAKIVDEDTSIRDLIDRFSKALKSDFGLDIFGQLLKIKLIDLQNRNLDIAIITDAGFEAEVQPITELGELLVVKIKRDGCDFSRDSRNYINPPFIPQITIENNGTKEELKAELKQKVIKEWLRL